MINFDNILSIYPLGVLSMDSICQKVDNSKNIEIGLTISVFWRKGSTSDSLEEIRGFAKLVTSTGGRCAFKLFSVDFQ